VHWNAAKAAEKSARTSVLDGVSERMPSLALAQKLLGKAAAVDVRVEPDASSPGIPAESPDDTLGLGTDPGSRRLVASEAELGDALLGLVSAARANGWDAERALRERLRVLTAQIRTAEAVAAAASGAGYLGS
jgi:XTP/dITP diphosphohydrolase